MGLALTLLVVGVGALINAFTSGSAGSTPTGKPSVTSDKPKSPAPSSGNTATPAPPLLIRVVGKPTNVLVKIAGDGTILQQGVLSTGDARQYDQTPLDVVANDSGAVEVLIYGKLQPPGRDGARGVWFVPKR